VGKMTKVSWKHDDANLAWPLRIEEKIDIFYEQIRGWQLHVADLIANGGSSLDNGAQVRSVPHAGFAVLQICLSYFETIGKYRGTPAGPDGAQFKAGALDVLPELQNVPLAVRERLLKVLYGKARCGLYHNSRTSHGVGLGPTPNGQAMGYDPVEEKLAISPHNLPRVLKSHLEKYRDELMDPNNADARESFQRRFDRDFGSKPSMPQPKPTKGP
jgi:hypothetical protein